jgi:hypothetical protein
MDDVMLENVSTALRTTTPNWVIKVMYITSPYSADVIALIYKIKK